MRKKKARLLLDCDEVLSDFASAAVKLYNSIAGSLVTIEEITEWDFTPGLANRFANKPQKDLFEKLLRSPGFAMSLNPLPGSKEAVQQLKEKLDVHIVTSPMQGSPTWAHERELWLHLHYGFPPSKIHHSHSKSVLSGDLFVDDKPSNVREWTEEHPNGTAFLWDTPRNRQDQDLERINSWQELLEKVSGRRTA